MSIPDSLVYLVNFQDESGFAVLSASKRLSESVYCITESGSINLQDFIDAASLFSSEDNTKVNNIEDESFDPIGISAVPALITSCLMLETTYDFPKEESTETKATGSKGHAWVLDGEWNDYYHINWGWGGIWDGYFKIDRL